MGKRARRIGVKASAKAGGVGGGWWDNPNAVQLARVESKIDKLTVLVNALTVLVNTSLKQEAGMAVDLTKLQAEVENATTVEASVLALLTQLSSAIKNIPPSSDPVTQAALDTLTATLAANDQALADAVTANTPAAS